MSNFKCAECGSELSTGQNSAVFDYNDDVHLNVEIYPCQKCIDGAYEVGKEAGGEAH